MPPVPSVISPPIHYLASGLPIRSLFFVGESGGGYHCGSLRPPSGRLPTFMPDTSSFEELRALSGWREITEPEFFAALPFDFIPPQHPPRFPSDSNPTYVQHVNGNSVLRINDLDSQGRRFYSDLSTSNSASRGSHYLPGGQYEANFRRIPSTQALFLLTGWGYDSGDLPRDLRNLSAGTPPTPTPTPTPEVPAPTWTYIPPANVPLRPDHGPCLTLPSGYIHPPHPTPEQITACYEAFLRLAPGPIPSLQISSEVTRYLATARQRLTEMQATPMIRAEPPYNSDHSREMLNCINNLTLLNWSDLKARINSAQQSMRPPLTLNLRLVREQIEACAELPDAILTPTHITFTTPDIIRELRNYGPMKVTLRFAHLWNGGSNTVAFLIEALNPYYPPFFPESDIIHPNVSHGKLCFGTAENTVHTALHNGHLSFACDHVVPILSSPSRDVPYNQTHFWPIARQPHPVPLDSPNPVSRDGQLVFPFPQNTPPPYADLALTGYGGYTPVPWDSVDSTTGCIVGREPFTLRSASTNPPPRPRAATSPPTSPPPPTSTVCSVCTADRPGGGRDADSSYICPECGGLCAHCPYWHPYGADFPRPTPATPAVPTPVAVTAG